MKNEVNVTYLGGPTVILEIGGLRLMTDPTLDPAGGAVHDQTISLPTIKPKARLLPR